MAPRKRTPQSNDSPTPKKTKGKVQKDDEPRPRTNFDRRKFISGIAEARCALNGKIGSRRCLPERGIHYDFGAIDQQLMQVIRKRDWFKFVQQVGPGCIPLVKEFYSNIPRVPQEERPIAIFVRGKQVPFSPEVINDYYNLPTLPSCQFLHIYVGDGEIDNQVILNKTCFPGTCWNRKGNDGQIFVQRLDLTPTARALFYFVSNTLLPGSHQSTIHFDSLLLVYCLLENLVVDVGRIIYHHIFELAYPVGKNADRRILPYPFLITELCRAQGIRILDSEEVVYGQEAITHKYFEKYIRESEKHRIGTSVSPVRPTLGHTTGIEIRESASPLRNPQKEKHSKKKGARKHSKEQKKKKKKSKLYKVWKTIGEGLFCGLKMIHHEIRKTRAHLEGKTTEELSGREFSGSQFPFPSSSDSSVEFEKNRYHRAGKQPLQEPFEEREEPNEEEESWPPVVHHFETGQPSRQEWFPTDTSYGIELPEPFVDDLLHDEPERPPQPPARRRRQLVLDSEDEDSSGN